jgi:putative oxidoreductase
MRTILLLPSLERCSDHALLALRLLTGGFLIYGVIDNVVSAERMREFATFLAASGFAAPDAMAPLSVYAQLAIGVLLVVGALTRWAGLLLAFNFVVGVVMVHWQQSFHEWWPAIVLVFLGLYFATRGAGRFGLDTIIGRNA